MVDHSDQRSQIHGKFAVLKVLAAPLAVSVYDESVVDSLCVPGDLVQLIVIGSESCSTGGVNGKSGLLEVARENTL